MSSSRSPQDIPSEEEDPRTIAYDPSDPFWHDTDEDDDDMDYVPATGGSEEEDGDSADLSFHDAAENLRGVEIEVEITEGGGEDEEDEEDEDQSENGEDGEEDEAEGSHSGRPIFISRNQIVQLLGTTGFRQLLATGSLVTATRSRGPIVNDNDSEGGTGYDPVGPRTRRGRGGGRASFEKVPSDEGKELMNNGTFGSNDRPSDRIKRKKNLAYNVMQRELGLGSDGRQKNVNRVMRQGMIPESMAETIIHYNSRCYSGQFSDDGNFFFSCAQDFKVRMYDTSNPYNWRFYKSVVYPYGQWTITDASLSPDNRFLAYSSIRSMVCLAPTDPNDTSEPNLLDFATISSHRTFRTYFGIWSIRFSGDGREIVAGTGDSSVYVYDIERQQSILRIPGHEDDVNAVCFGDSLSPHILYSGSDDTTLKVWDRRSMGDGREAGVFLGHTEGLTYVDSKGDGRYVLSNGKDQTAKLWDLRRMHSKEKADQVDINAYTTHFEYRTDAYDHCQYQPHPYDCSLVTFRGHKVLRTLIRCHFSPPGSTDSRYVYSGSYDGKVYVWNLDATLAGKINVLQSTKGGRPRDPNMFAETYDFYGRNGDSWMTCVRDASWHPNAPIVAATSWNGWGTSQGTCTVHTWNDGLEEDEGEPKVGTRVNALLQPDERLYAQTNTERRHWYDDYRGDDYGDDD